MSAGKWFALIALVAFVAVVLMAFFGAPSTPPLWKGRDEEAEDREREGADLERP